MAHLRAVFTSPLLASRPAQHFTFMMAVTPLTAAARLCRAIFFSAASHPSSHFDNHGYPRGSLSRGSEPALLRRSSALNPRVGSGVGRGKMCDHGPRQGRLCPGTLDSSPAQALPADARRLNKLGGIFLPCPELQGKAWAISALGFFR